jgi:hypothetical protein
MNKIKLIVLFLAIAIVFTLPTISFSSVINKNITPIDMGKSDDSCDIAIKNLTQEILSNPEVSENYYDRARCYFEKGEYENALSDYNKSISIKEWANNLYDRAIVYKEMYEQDKSNIFLVKNALNDFLNVKKNYPNFEQINDVNKYIKELKDIISVSETTGNRNHEDLGNGLYIFHLKNLRTLYIRFPVILSSATFNIIKQHPSNEGKESSEFLLFRGTFKQFLDSIVSCINITQNEDKLFIMTIDENTKIGLQEKLLYGADTNNLHPPSEHYAWFPEPVNNEWPVTGWLIFDENLPQTISDNLPENYVEHNGKLKIRVLKDSKPVKLIGSSLSCAKVIQPELFDIGVYEILVEISDCETTQINLKLATSRWLLDKSFEPLLMPDYYLEINGKIFPNKMQYVIYSKDGKSVDFVVNLKRVPR